MTDLSEVVPDEWDELLVRLGASDVYLRRAYLESASRLGQGRPVFLRLAGREGEVVFPCLVRDAGGGHGDVGTPMGLGGPVAVGSQPPVAAFFEAYERWCGENRIVATFARFHPVLGNHVLAEGRWRLQQVGHSIGWRIAGRGADELLAGMDAHHRRVVRRARRSRLEVSLVESPRDLDGFSALYEETMRRRKAPAFYFFPDPYWRFLATELRDALVRLDAHQGSELVGSILCFASPPALHYHLGCSSELGRSLGASHLLFLEAAAWAAARDLDLFHLGGGVGGFEDSLYEFKRRFDPGGRLPAFVGKAVHDVDAYLELAGSPEIDYAGYFPAYRRP